jgi:uncharacterized membrane protein YgcG
MNCKEIQLKLLEYWVGELPDNLNRSIENHMKTCPICQKELEGLKKTMDLFSQLPEIELEPEQQGKFLSEVRNKIRHTQTRPLPQRRMWWLLPRLVPALAAASILIFFVTMKLKSSDVKQTNLVSKIFTSPSLSLSGEFVLNYFGTNGNGAALNEVLTGFDSTAVDKIEDYLINQTEISDLVKSLTDEEKSQLVQKIEKML